MLPFGTFLKCSLRRQHSRFWKGFIVRKAREESEKEVTFMLVNQQNRLKCPHMLLEKPS